ncbi:MAG: DUF3135 domain-containing protein [Candidatus Yonathbacteria bacterium]|nr:DUF3135 domain-containing protein [Candidatus Yonathbacteria bacterium]
MGTTGNNRGSSGSGSDIFFKYWSNLSKSDPERFEKERKRAIEEVISRAPSEHQQGLRQLQWVIDGERRKAKNPIDAMVRLNKMMWTQFYAKDGFVSIVFYFNRIRKILNETEKDKAQERKDAIILPFKKD